MSKSFFMLDAPMENGSSVEDVCSDREADSGSGLRRAHRLNYVNDRAPFTSNCDSEEIVSADCAFETKTSKVSREISHTIAVSDTKLRDPVSQELHSSILRNELSELMPLGLNAQHAPRSTTPDVDAISLATTTSCDGDGDGEKSSPPKHRQGRRTKKWLNDADKEPLNYELEIGARILGDFMVEANKALTWPFLNKVDPFRDGVADYYNVIKHPVWFNLSKSKLSA